MRTTGRTLVLAIIIAAAELLMAVPVAAAKPLPACRYDGVLTRYFHVPEWRMTLLDTIRRVPRGYAPSHLVSTANAGVNGGHRVRQLVIEPLRRMAVAARGADAAIRVRSAYRSYRRQKEVFRQEVARYGYTRALQQVARPGHSEHQLGTALDFMSAGDSRDPWDLADWGDTRAGRWMKHNAWRYGFVMSYPEGKRKYSCYSYEPWHYRFVGETAAAAIHEQGVTLRKYLWETFETAP